MMVKQISVFVENKQGRLLAITDILARNNINIRALSVADTSEFGILRLIVDQPEVACQLLLDANVTAKLTQVLAVEVEDKAGGMCDILKALSEGAINLEYLYAFLGRKGDDAIIIFQVEQPEEACVILQEAGVNIIKGEDIYGL